jgi:hypothetical protein
MSVGIRAFHPRLAASVVLVASFLSAPRPAAASKSPVTPEGMTIEKLVRLAVAASGGAERIRALRSLRMTGRIAFTGGATVPIAVELARPARVRTEMTFPAGAWIQAFDGRNGWTVSPFAKVPGPAPMTAEQRRSAAEQADLEGPLVDPEKKGIRLALEGKVVVDGKDAWRLRVDRPGGAVRYLDLDAATSLKVRWEGELGEGEERSMNASLFSDYRPVEGFAFPFRIESGPLGGTPAQEIVFEKIEVNPAIPDSDFEPPK